MKLYYLGYLLVYYLAKVLESGYFVAKLILKGYKGDASKEVFYCCNQLSDWQLVLLFNLISMTPGSMSIALDEQNQCIRVHLLDEKEEDSFFRVTQKMEAIIKRAI